MYSQLSQFDKLQQQQQQFDIKYLKKERNGQGNWTSSDRNDHG